MRSKKAALNTIISLLFEIITVISAFILPRLVINSFGSDVNGITQAVSQFIGYISLLSAGVGGVTVAALYKPISENDTKKISSIVNATESFLRNISRIFVGALIIFAFVFPFFVINDFDYWYSFALVLILGIGTFGNYYFGMTYRLVLEADQKIYVNRIIQIVILIIHTFVSVVLINNGATIHIVKLVSSLIFLMNPIFIYVFVRKRYNIDKSVEADYTTIEQRWDAFAHQIANFVNNNTDLVILLIFVNAKEVSVYTVYYLVLNGIRAFINSLITGVTAAFGNMIAKGEMKAVEKNLKLYEFLLHSVGIILYVTMALLITSFIDLYVKGVTDVNYHRPVFGYLLSAIGFFVAVRIPYQAVTRAAGHFRQTRNGAIFEAVLNIVLSLSLIVPFGMNGLAIGTLAAGMFRTIQFGLYSSKNIVDRSVWVIIKRFTISFINALIILIVVYFIPLLKPLNYLNWAINGVIITSIGIIITLIFSLVFYLEDFKNFVGFVLRLLKRGTKINKKNNL